MMENRENKAIDLEQLENVNGGNIIEDAAKAAINMAEAAADAVDDLLCKTEPDMISVIDDPRKAKPTRLI